MRGLRTFGGAIGLAAIWWVHIFFNDGVPRWAQVASVCAAFAGGMLVGFVNGRE